MTEQARPADRKKKLSVYEQADAKVQTSKTQVIGSARRAYQQALHHVGFPAIEIADKVAALEGAIVADNATIRRYQRQGLGELRRPAREADPWRERSLVIAWPNEKSRARSAKYGRGHLDWGPLPRWVLPLRTSTLLQSRYGLPKPLASAPPRKTSLWALPSNNHARRSSPRKS